MTVDVKFFASLRDEMGCAGCTLTAPASMAALLDELEAQFGPAAQALTASGVRIALNQTLVPSQTLPQTRLSAGDEVAFLPPVTGG